MPETLQRLHGVAVALGPLPGGAAACAPLPVEPHAHQERLRREYGPPSLHEPSEPPPLFPNFPCTLDFFQFQTTAPAVPAAATMKGMQDMAETANAQCQSCRYYDTHKLNVAQAQGGQEGVCRFNPPVTQPGPQEHGLWPVVSASDWCGHYSPDIMAGE